jgi:hypothetical protein
MRRIITTYFAVVLLLSLGFFGVGARASAQELRDPMQPPPAAQQKFNGARLAKNPVMKPAKPAKTAQKPLQLTSILYSPQRKIAIIDDQMLAVGDRIRGAELIRLTRASARLLRNGKIINLSLGNELTTVAKKPVESDL